MSVGRRRALGRRVRPRAESLEGRQLMATFAVTSLADSGDGSLRAAIVAANAQPGADAIRFDVAGTIRVGRTALPTITDPVALDASTAPDAGQRPVVTIDYRGTRGLTIDQGADGSAVRGLALVNAGGAGLTLRASRVTVQDNYVGLKVDGSAAGNRGDGILVEASSSGSLIGQLDASQGFRLSNVISSNRGDGIELRGSGNFVAMNNIGTDAAGVARRANGGNGILITAGAAGNLIGGVAETGNDPTGGTFVRPPQGNLISGNDGDGVLITNGATGNQLSGNFIGTDAAGSIALGNRGDGVAIVRASGNSLIGCALLSPTLNPGDLPANGGGVRDVLDLPFAYYNVVSGNGGNGLRVTDSDDTTVHANFFGAGANNATVVANRGDGILVSGSSRNTQVGGVIPLGNVSSGNGRHGIEVTGTASGFTSFNTFAGLFAFSGAAPNRGDGIRITSTGGDNLIRTTIVSGNLGNGITLAGGATGVQITESGIGTNTVLTNPLPNGGDGILLTGNAHDNAIGGFQASIVPQVTVSANNGNGIAITGRARDNSIVNTFVGTAAADPSFKTELGNRLAGIVLGAGTRGTRIGGTDAASQVRVRYNGGDGVTIQSSRGNTIVGSLIANNARVGLRATGNDAGTVVRGTTINSNGAGDVDLAGSTGVTYAP